MKPILLITLTLFASSLFSQKEKINCIIFIDGKLTPSSSDFYFAHKDSTGQINRINFDYVIGDILMESEALQKLKQMNYLDSITMNISYTYNNGINRQYSRTILADWLFMDIFIVRITNLDMETGKYYFAFSTPDFDYKFLFKEYMIFQED
jgi:hypothetical protein